MFSFLSIPAFLAGGFAIQVLGALKRKNSQEIAVLASALSVIFSFSEAVWLAKGKIDVAYMSGWAAPFGIALVIDWFSMLFILCASVMSLIVVLYSTNYIRDWEVEYYTLLMLLFAGVFGILHTGDLFNFFVFFEIMSIAAYALTSFHKNKKALEASMKYLLLGTFTASLLLLGIAMLYGITGTLNIADMAVYLRGVTSPAIPVAFGLVFVGLALKSAIVPFHYLKGDIIEASLPQVGAFFASIVTAVGIYAISRIYFTIFDTGFLFHQVMIATGLLSIAVGSLLALKQKNVLRLIAYSAIAQTGFVVLALGMGAYEAYSYTAAVFHLLNVIFIDMLLFITAGAVVLKYGSADMDSLAGSGNSLGPVISGGFLVAAVSNAGVPLTNGFASKWMIYVVSFGISPVITIIAVVASVLTLAYSLKAYSVIFLSSGKKAKISGPGIKVEAPVMLLCFFCIVFGILYSLGIDLSQAAVDALFDKTQYLSEVLG